MKIKHILHTYRLKFGKALLDAKPRQISASQTKHLNTFLFLRQDGKIGDAIVSSFVFREIKKNNPNAFIGVVCTQKNQFLFKNNPLIDKIFLVKRRSILSRIFLGLKLRKYQFDALIDPTFLLRNRELLFIRLIGAKNNVGYCKSSYKIFNKNIENSDLHFSSIYKKALERVGIPNVNTRYEMAINSSSQNEITEYLDRNNLKNYIAVNLFGAGAKRCFNEQKAKALLCYLIENTDKNIVVLTFPAVTEKLINWLRDIKSSRLYLFEKTTKIDHSMAIINEAAMVISPDTSIVHITSGLHKPLIAFYSEDDENFVHWHPNNIAPTMIIRYKETINHIDLSQIPLEFLK